jgi:hypothetical protein
MIYRLIVFASAFADFVSETRELRRKLSQRYRTIS